MIWTVAKKEFLEKILDSRVTISFLIAIALTVLAVFVVSQEYRTQKTAYDQAIANSQADLNEVKVFSQYKPDVVFPPTPLSLFSRGIDLPAPMIVNIRLDWVPRFGERIAAGSNPIMRIFDTLDLATVIQILFALLVILLTYDSFSGEKENGTLRLVLSNPVSRVELLYGKIIGSLFIVAAVVVVTFSIALLSVQVFSGIALETEYYARSLLILLISFLYLSIFAVLGTCASIWFQQSSSSLAVSLLIWLVVGFLQPNVNRYLVSEFGSTPRLDDLRPTLAEARNSYLKELERLQAQYGHLLADRSKLRYIQGQTSIGTVILPHIAVDADYAILQYLIKQVQAYRESARSADTEWGLYKSLYLDRLETQLRWKRLLELFSPAALFTRSISVISRTDIDNVEDFLYQAREYRQQYLAYLDQKGIFSTNAQLFFSRLSREDIDPSATAWRLAQYAKDPNRIPWIQNQSPLDLSDAPVFGARKPMLITDSEEAARTVLPLIIYIALLVIWTGRSFSVYDPR